MGRRKKSRASSAAAAGASGQDVEDQVSRTGSRQDEVHDNISEIKKALAANAAYQTKLKEQLRLLRSGASLSPPETTLPKPSATSGSPNNVAVNPDNSSSICVSSLAMEGEGEHKNDGQSSLDVDQSLKKLEIQGNAKKRSKPIAKQSWKPIPGLIYLQEALPFTN